MIDILQFWLGENLMGIIPVGLLLHNTWRLHALRATDIIVRGFVSRRELALANHLVRCAPYIRHSGTCPGEEDLKCIYPDSCTCGHNDILHGARDPRTLTVDV